MSKTSQSRAPRRDIGTRYDKGSLECVTRMRTKSRFSFEKYPTFCSWHARSLDIDDARVSPLNDLNGRRTSFVLTNRIRPILKSKRLKKEKTEGKTVACMVKKVVSKRTL